MLPKICIGRASPEFTPVDLSACDAQAGMTALFQSNVTEITSMDEAGSQRDAMITIAYS